MKYPIIETLALIYIIVSNIYSNKEKNKPLYHVKTNTIVFIIVYIFIIYKYISPI